MLGRHHATRSPGTASPPPALRGVTLAALLAGLLAGLLTAGTGTAADPVPTVGLVVAGGCGLDRDIYADSGELLALKVDGPTHDDWQLDLTGKGGTLIGMVPGDVAGAVFQVLDNWSRPTLPSHVAFVLVSFSGGEVYLDSGFTDGFNYLGEGLVQRVGDSSPFLVTSGGITLPGTAAGWTADLGAGAEAFPKALTGAVEIAFAPLVEDNDLDLGGCTGGSAALDPSSNSGLVIGYNAFRLPDAGLVPTPAEIGLAANWQAFLPVGDGLDTSATLGTLHDPDSSWGSGDEVVVLRDGPLNGDGSPRATGTPPDPSGNTSYWYAFQPVVAGDLAEFAALSLAGLPVTDFRVDVDGDTVPDGVDFDPAGGNGPELVSPQAAAGLPGLGLTHGGEPLLSAVVLGTPAACLSPNPADLTIDDLRVGKLFADEAALSWTDRDPVVGPGTRYDVASETLTRLWTVDVADADCVANAVATPDWSDARPVAVVGFYYLARAVDPCGSTPPATWGTDSLGSARPVCP